MRDTSAEFIPPCPTRPGDFPPLVSLIRMARLNFLSVFAASDFSSRILILKVLRRQIVVCNGPGHIKKAFQEDHEIVQRKSAQARHALKPLIGDGIFISDGDVWKKRRALVVPVINGSRLKAYIPTMVQTVEDLRVSWRVRGDGAELDMQEEMANLTAEVICRTVFSSELGRSYTSAIVENFTRYQKSVDQIDLLSLIGAPDWFPRPNHLRIRRSARGILNVLDEIIDRAARQADTGSASVLDGLMNARDDDGNRLTREAIRNEAAVMFLAAQETTANTLTWAWYLLSQSPAVRARVQQEVDEVLRDGGPSRETFAKLTYTRAVIDETLRLYPPVPLLARETLGEITIAGRTYRKGTIVLAIPWLLHRSPLFWKDPAVFRPERHLSGHPLEETARSKYTFLPFGVGPRICPGQLFGTTEAVLALASLAREFSPELKPGTKIEPQARLSLRISGGLPMILRRRRASRGIDAAGAR